LTHFFIEFRLSGFAEEYARWVDARVYREARRLRIRKLKHKFPPHITLFGEAKTHNLRGVIANVERVGRHHTLVPFKMGGFSYFPKPDEYWLYLDVDPSPELEQLRFELAQTFIRSEKLIANTCKEFDHSPKYSFHCSIIRCNPSKDWKFKEKSEKLLEYARTKCTLENFRQHKASLLDKLVLIIKKYIFGAEEGDPNIHLHLLRIRISGKGGGEYDLLLKKLLTGRKVWSRFWRRRSIEALKTELSPPREEHLSLSNSSKLYFIGDTHFGHKNIIKHCDRPFPNVAKMDKVIKQKWNSNVGESDTVYFLGDYTGPPRRLRKYYEKLQYLTEQLKGNKKSILGNHDRIGGCVKFEKAVILKVDGGPKFLLIHNPADQKINYIKGKYDWIIHGHVHNNKMDRYPFINGEEKTINVSVELIDYKPVSLSFLLSLGLDSIRCMRTIDSQPEKW
jgi:calcineurin-like phosphoesterase family protein/2'-5' RNA ligase